MLLIVMLFMYVPSKEKEVSVRSLKEDQIVQYAAHEEFIFNDDALGDIVQ